MFTLYRTEIYTMNRRAAWRAWPPAVFNKSRSKLASPLILRRRFPDGFPSAGLSQKWKKPWKTLYGRCKKGRGIGRKAQNGKGTGKGRREGRFSPQSPHSFPFSAQHPTTFGARYAGYHRRVYSSVKSLLAGATLACLTEVILFAFFRLGRHFSGMHAYWCIDSYAPMSANKNFNPLLYLLCCWSPWVSIGVIPSPYS